MNWVDKYCSELEGKGCAELECWSKENQRHLCCDHDLYFKSSHDGTRCQIYN